MPAKVAEEDAYRSDLDGLGQGQLGNGRGCRSGDVGPVGAVLLAGRVHGSSQDLGLGLLDQQLLLRGQGQLHTEDGTDGRTETHSQTQGSTRERKQEET